ncbi:MAG: hypothetical protein QNJ77_13515 [Acidimicrobiia bacterium]|nr:hypothetical protein [Acidimicrobiia bacterium]
MEALVHNITAIAGRMLFNPLLLTVPVLGLLALVTGAAGRIATAFQDFQQTRR